MFLSPSTICVHSALQLLYYIIIIYSVLISVFKFEQKERVHLCNVIIIVIIIIIIITTATGLIGNTVNRGRLQYLQ